MRTTATHIVIVFAAVLGAFLVVRAGTELAQLHYGDPSSYRNDWGGPSLAGVLAVHCGPGLVVLGGAGWFLRRRVAARRPGR